MSNAAQSAAVTGLGYWKDWKDEGSTLVAIQNKLEIYITPYLSKLESLFKSIM